MQPSILTRIAWRTLLALVIFNAISAVGGAIAMLFTNGLGMPQSALDGGPFTSYFLPALILLIAIGGTHTLSTVLLLRRRKSCLFWTAVAGFAMIIWILTETAIIRGFSWLQGIYFGAGVAELALVFAMLGIVSWLPRIDLGIGKTPKS
ncbi:hypothetical protein [Leifsonia sp. A12D58]|uniref:hypothetical protein n=1 Tax=Leifsonia sp. A12D58 TaxID=3397674 RepID=UPI0039E03A7A